MKQFKNRFSDAGNLKKPGCIACGFREYEMILRTGDAAPVVCIACGQEIGPPYENVDALSTPVLLAQADLARRIALWGHFRGALNLASFWRNPARRTGR